MGYALGGFPPKTSNGCNNPLDKWRCDMEQQEFLGQLRLVLDSLQMESIYDYIDNHGNIKSVTCSKWNTKVRFDDDYMVIFNRWDFY